MTNKTQYAEMGHTKQLVLVFCAWKALLLLLAAFCPGPGYDTSGLILLDPSLHRHNNFVGLTRSDRLTLNLLRWDALYFVKAAERGQVHEQAWAFSWAYSHLMRQTGRTLSSTPDTPLRYYVMAGFIVSTVCHLLSVLVLYRLSALVLKLPQRRNVSFVAAVLHILTPASLFMCAPYAEAMFSFLNFTGMFLYAHSRSTAEGRGPSALEDVCKLGSGLFFAFAALMRSNGLLSGSILLYDVARYVPRVTSAQLSMFDIRRIIVSCLAGVLVALGFVGPQYVAYKEFCYQERDIETRPWCEKSLPSIYSWVQSHYWNVGFFRYWTVSNLPLFLLAAPILWLLFVSSVRVLRSCVQHPLDGRPVPRDGETFNLRNGSSAICRLPELALPQLLLAVAATTSFHIQIVNRIASGYPVWYLLIATWLVDGRAAYPGMNPSRLEQWMVRGIVVYALTQGMLFANFLPPA